MIYYCILKSINSTATYYISVEAECAEAAEEFCRFICPNTVVKYTLDEKSSSARRIYTLDDTELIELIANKDVKYYNKIINNTPYLYVEYTDTGERIVYRLTP